MSLITVQTFDNPIDLYLVKSKLESSGVHCFVFDEHTVSINPLISNGIGGIKLKVSTNDAEKAVAVLKEIQLGATLDDAGKSRLCPNCGLPDLYTNFKSMKGVKGILSMLTMFAFMAFPFYHKNVYKCKSCGMEFK